MKKIGYSKLIITSLLFSPFFYGCSNPDAESRLDEFMDLTKDLRNKKIDSGKGTKVDFSGKYIMVMATPFGPFYFSLVPKVASDLSTFEMTIQAVGHPDQKSPYKLVGDVLTYKNIKIEEDGTFILALGEQTFVGDANGATGAPFTVDVTLHGTISSSSSFCGFLMGKVIRPVDMSLDNSSFGTIKYKDGADISKLQFTDKCNKSDAGQTNTQPVNNSPEGDTNNATVVVSENPFEKSDDTIYLCTKTDLTGDWDFEFRKAGTSKPRVDLFVHFDKDSEKTDEHCYKGVVKSSGLFKTDLGKIESVVMENGRLKIRMPKYTEGSKNYNFVALVDALVDDAMCGFYVAKVKDGSKAEVEEQGTWSMKKKGTTNIKEVSLIKKGTTSGCAAVPTKKDCSYFNDLVSDKGTTYKLFIKSISGKSNAAITLKRNELSCISGSMHAVDDDKNRVGYITEADPTSKSFTVTGFFVPKSVAPYNFDEKTKGGWGSNQFTISKLVPLKTICGSNAIHFEKGAILIKDVSATFAGKTSDVPTEVCK